MSSRTGKGKDHRSRRSGQHERPLDATCGQTGTGAEPNKQEVAPSSRGRLLSNKLVRVWLPLITTLSGFVAIAIGRDEIALEGGAMLIGAGVAIWLSNWLLRVGFSGDKDRNEEQDTRDYFKQHGHWPDQ